MIMRWFAGLTLSAVVLGAQPACAHQLTNAEVARDAVGVGFLVGLVLLQGAGANCDVLGHCATRPLVETRTAPAGGVTGRPALPGIP